MNREPQFYLAKLQYKKRVKNIVKTCYSISGMAKNLDPAHMQPSGPPSPFTALIAMPVQMTQANLIIFQCTFPSNQTSLHVPATENTPAA